MNISNYLKTKNLPDADDIVKRKGMHNKVKSFAGDLIDQVILAAIDPHRSLHSTQLKAIELLWPMMLKVMDEESIVPVLDLHGKTPNEQVEVVLLALTNGEIDFTQAKQYLEILNNALDLTEMRELKDRLDEMMEQGLLN